MKPNFKIVDSFLFSEVYEKELMLLKFKLEDEGIAEWIILENAYSFQGEYTGLHARLLLDSDERFNPYKHKITIISREQPTKTLPKHEFLDEFSFQVEYWQRDLAYDYFMEKYSAEDWIMVADVDEMIDFTHEGRRNELYEKMHAAQNGLLQVPTRRFWYDFDNEYQQIIGNAMCNKKYLVDTGKKLHHIRQENRRVMQTGWQHMIQFEYSTCYQVDYMLRKQYTSTHTGFSLYDLKQSLRCNHRPVRGNETNRPKNNKKYFFETIPLTYENAPAYVVDHLAFYKTNAVDTNYGANRRNDYPELFKLTYFINEYLQEKKKWVTKKMKALQYKLRMKLSA